jgi:hypothetical protein
MNHYAGYKKETQDIEAVKDKILERRRAGVCDLSGRSVKRNGRTIAMPRGGRVTFVKKYKWRE